MKNLPSRASILGAFISILIVSFFPSLGHSQNFNVYEQEGFSSQDKGKIADFYWQLSQELFDQKQFDEAIFQVQRVYELQPGDKKVASFVKKAKREKMNYVSSKD